MVWTEEQDLLLCREIIKAAVFSSKTGALQRSATWNQVASQLCEILRWTNDMLNFNVIFLP